MMKYEIRMTEGKHPVPVVVFEDRKYELVGAFLLAEARSFSDEILHVIDAVCVDGGASGEFAGNVFRLEIAAEMTNVVDDIMGKECEIGTKELRGIVEAYCKACCD